MKEGRLFMDLNLDNKVAFICASSQGLGKACAQELSEEGAKVIISGRNNEKLKNAAKEIESKTGNEVDYVVCDLINLHDIKSAISYVIKKHHKIDILINNAGGPPSGSFEEMEESDWYHAFELNLLSHVRCIKEALPYMKREKYGKIINLTSTSINQPIPNLILSNTFRIGVVGLAKTLSEELAKYNILVNTVAPGRITTNRLEELDEKNAKKKGVTVTKVQESSTEKISLHRYGNPAEISSFVAFLASDRSSYATGAQFVIDGGLTKSI